MNKILFKKIAIVLILTVIFGTVTAQTPLVRYLRTQHTTQKGQKLEKFTKVIVSKSDTTAQTASIVYPVSAEVPVSDLLSQKQIDELHAYHSYKAQEMKNAAESGDKSVLFVGVNTLNIREENSQTSEDIGTLSMHESIKIDASYSDKEWYKITEPKQGYVFKKYVLTPEQAKTAAAEHQQNAVLARKSITQTAFIPEKQIEKLNCKTSDSAKISVLDEKAKPENYYVIENQQKLKTDYIAINFLEPKDADGDGFPAHNTLIVTVNDKTLTSKYRMRILCREKNADDYVIFQTSPEFSSEKSMKMKIGRKPQLAHGEYNFRFEVFDTENKFIMAITNANHAQLTNLKFETAAEDQPEGANKNSSYIALMPSFAPYFFPVENGLNANLDRGLFKNKYPWSIQLEYASAKYPVAVGLGYNSVKDMLTSSESFRATTKTAYLYFKYVPIKYWENRIEPFVSLGLSKWYSTFENIEYSDMTTYYEVYKDNGIGFLAGLGVMLDYKNFLFGVQYQLYSGKRAVFGEEPLDPETSEEFGEWEPKTQYEIYTGSNQLQISIGYRLKF